MQMRLPEWLLKATDTLLHGVSTNAMAAAYTRLSDDYRSGRPTLAGDKAEMFWLAYLCGRMPGTFAAVSSVLSEIPPELLKECGSMLDLGSGPGTASWAAIELLPELKAIQGLEADPAARELANKLAKKAPFKPEFSAGDLNLSVVELAEADLVVAAYASSELHESQREAFYQKAWAKTKRLLVLVEPGTPAGFAAVLQARALLLQAGAKMVAPCPGGMDCPMKDMSPTRWCHFSQRLERNRLGQILKGGELGYEDEKFSYLVFSKQPALPSPGRIMNFPKKLKGHLKLELCTTDGLVMKTQSKKDGALYKAARKSRWGDAWPPRP
ncbi:MAG: small ribosomal subunit Rsm22 family protein [candidate division FCPU426 bacterium]